MWLRWSCVLQLPGIATQNRAGAAHEVCRQCEWAQVLRGLEALPQVEANIARVALIRQSGENVVPKRFRTFISIHFRDTYIFDVSKIGLTVAAGAGIAAPQWRPTKRSRAADLSVAHQVVPA